MFQTTNFWNPSSICQVSGVAGVYRGFTLLGGLQQHQVFWTKAFAHGTTCLNCVQKALWSSDGEMGRKPKRDLGDIFWTFAIICLWEPLVLRFFKSSFTCDLPWSAELSAALGDCSQPLTPICHDQLSCQPHLDPQQIQTILEISAKSPQTTILVAFVIFPVPNPISKAFLIISSSTCPSQVDTSSISSISWRKCWWHPEKYRRVRDREDRAPGPDRVRVWKTWRRSQQADASRRRSSNIKMSWRKWRKWMGADGGGPEIRIAGEFMENPIN